MGREGQLAKRRSEARAAAGAIERGREEEWNLLTEEDDDHTVLAWTILEAMVEQATNRGIGHHMMDSYLDGVRMTARRQKGYLLGWQVRVAVAFLIAASEHPPDAIDEGDLTPYWIKSEDAARVASGIVPGQPHFGIAPVMS